MRLKGNPGVFPVNVAVARANVGTNLRAAAATLKGNVPA